MRRAISWRHVVVAVGLIMLAANRARAAHPSPPRAVPDPDLGCAAAAPSDKDETAYEDARERIINDIYRGPDSDEAFAALRRLLSSASGERYAVFRAHIQSFLATDSRVNPVAGLELAQDARQTLTKRHCDTSDALEAEAEAYLKIGAVESAAQIYDKLAASITAPDRRDDRIEFLMKAASALSDAGDFETTGKRYKAAQADAVAEENVEKQKQVREAISELNSAHSRALAAAVWPRRVVNYNASDEITDAALCPTKNILATLGKGRQGAPSFEFADETIESDTNTLQLWDIESQAALWNIPSQGEHVVFSGDCSLLASVSTEATVIDSATGRVLKTFPAPGPVDFSPDGNFIWVGFAVFDVRSGAPEWIMRPPADLSAKVPILAVNYAHNLYLVGSADSGLVEIRDRKLSTVRTVPTADGSPPTAAAINHDGTRAIIGTQKGTFSLINLETQKELGHFQFADTPVTSVQISNHGWTIMVQSRDKVFLTDLRNIPLARKASGGMAAVSTAEDGIGLWQARGSASPLEVIDFWKNQTRSLSGFGGDIDAITFTPNSNEMIFTGNGNIYSLDFGRGRIRSYDFSGVDILHTPFQMLSTSTDGQTLFASPAVQPGSELKNAANGLLVFHRSTGRSTFIESPHRKRIASLQVVPDNTGSNSSLILSSDGSGAAILWNPFTGAAIHRYASDTGEVTLLSVSADGSRVLSAGKDGTVRLFDVKHGKSSILKRYAKDVHAIALSSDGEFAASCEYDHELDLWHIGGPAQSRQWSDDYCANMSFVGDSTLVVVGSFGHMVALNTTSDKQVEIADEKVDDSVLGVAESAGKVMYRTTGSNGGVFLVDVGNIWSTPSAPLPTIRVKAIQGSHSKLSLSSDSQIMLAVHNDISVHEYNTVSGKEVCSFANPNVIAALASVSASGARIIAPLKNGYVALWDASTCKPSQVVKHPEKIVALRITNDETRLVTASEKGNTRILNVADGVQIARIPGHEEGVTKALMSPNGRYVVTKDSRGSMLVWDPKTEAALFPLNIHVSKYGVADPEFVFLSDNRLAVHEPGIPDVGIAGGFVFDEPKVGLDFPSHIGIWDLETRKEVGALPSQTSSVYLFADPAEAETVLSLDHEGPFLTSWNYHRPVPDFQEKIGAATAPAFSKDGKLLAVRLGDGRVELWDHTKRKELFSVILTNKDQWTLFTPDGRFETASFDQSTFVSWVLQGRPFRALPMEFLTQQYFEPGLVPKALTGVLGPIRAPEVKSLERPKVTVTSVDPSGAGKVNVSVKLERTGLAQSTGDPADGAQWPPVEVRLFRDGQLVAISDKTSSGRTDLPRGGESLLSFPDVQIPSNAEGLPVRFAAYAFSPEGVRSEISPEKDFKADSPMSHAERRAYVVAVGVNASANPAWDLHFAVNDAQDFSDEMRARLTGVEVVSVTLTSEHGETAQRTATKSNLEQVFRCLASGACDSQLLGQIPSGKLLRQVRPEDFVIIFIASHGYRDSDGRFYLFPYDVNQDAGAAVTESDLQTFISGDLLQRWLLPIDSQHIAMILDTCDSQYSVEEQGFKPAPLPNRNFGELAFDKGMKVLTATKTIEPDDSKLKHGWLTNRLLVNGLYDSKADFDPSDGTLWLTEWLRYGEEVQGPITGDKSDQNQQQPYLFDFGNWRTDLSLKIGQIPKP